MGLILLRLYSLCECHTLGYVRGLVRQFCTLEPVAYSCRGNRRLCASILSYRFDVWLV